MQEMRLLVPLLAVGLAATDLPAATLELRVQPHLGGDLLRLDAPRALPLAGTVTVSRLDFLLCHPALRRAEDGAWIQAGDWHAFLRPAAGRDTARLPAVPAGRYTALRFDLGVSPAADRADPARHPPGHPLHPGLNQLHWGWMGGYIYLALEGRYGTSDPPAEGFSLHLATEALRPTVELAVDLDLTRDRRLDLTLDLDPLLAASPLAPATAVTHSRAGDPVAVRLAAALPAAFRVRAVTDSPTPPLAPPSGDAERPPGLTPYRLTIPDYFPRPDLPRDNPLTEEGVALGHDLFLEPLLSRNDAVSCASCHQPSAWFSDVRRFSPGVDRQLGTRQSMPLFNLAWRDAFFWDGRAPSLRAQAMEPIQNPLEMHETLANVEAKLAAHPDYPDRFALVFGSPGVTRERIGLAIEQFLLTRVSHRSRFDRSLRGEVTLSDEEQQGFVLFHTEFDPGRGLRGADCFHCHGGPLFQSQSFANNGLDLESADPGRAAVTGRPADRGKFLAPTLRNIALTPPYMHDGRFFTLEEVVEHYDRGVRRGPNLDPNLAKHPAEGLGLTAEEKRALVAFLRTLSEPP
jgi:cytochrome c peroxidase